MLSVFQIFKIIMGLILAGFFLFFLLRFSGIYTEFQGGQNQLDAIRALERTARDVVIYDVPVEFKGFSRWDRRGELSYEPPFVYASGIESKVTGVTLFMVPGGSMNIYRGGLDFGWRKFAWAAALPQMKVYYNPANCTSDCWDVMEKVTMMFPQGQPSTGFGFCNGSGITEAVDRDYLAVRLGAAASDPAQPGPAFLPCSYRPKKNEIVVSFVGSETYPESGFALQPLGNGTSRVYFRSVNDMNGRVEYRSFMCADALDVFALVTGGEKAFRYKNERLASEISTAAKKEAGRAKLVMSVYGRHGRESSCTGLYQSLYDAMQTLSELAESAGMRDAAGAAELAEAHGLAAQIYSRLEDSGCE